MSLKIFESLVSSSKHNNNVISPYNWIFELCDVFDSISFVKVLIIGGEDNTIKLNHVLLERRPSLSVAQFNAPINSANKLPFSSNSFDLVILSAPKAENNLSAEFLCSDSLFLISYFKEISRVLRDDGKVLFAINKWEGRPSLLKYWMSCFYYSQRSVNSINVRFAQADPIIGRYLSQILPEADFKIAKIDMVLPDLQSPSICMPYNSVEALPYALSFVLGSKWQPIIKTMKIVIQALRFIPKTILKNIICGSIPDAYVTVNKSSSYAETGFEYNILKMMCQINPAIKSMFRVRTSEKVIYVGIDNSGMPKQISKILSPFHRKVQDNNPVADMSGVPRTIKKCKENIVVIEPWISGKPVSFLNISHQNKVLNWLIDLHNSYKSGEWSREEAQKYVEEPINVISQLKTECNKEAFKFYTIAANRFLDCYDIWAGKIQTTPEHGDFVPSNILINKNNELKIIDCEGSLDKGCSLFDISCFLYASAAGEPQVNTPNILFQTLTGHGKRAKAFKILTSKICQMHKICETIMLDFSLIAFARKVMISQRERRIKVADMWLRSMEVFCKTFTAELR